jgi:cellobiose phosphorylase
MAFAALGKRDKVWELFCMVQPISHGSNDRTIETYKAEPYVMAADVYANEMHKGRGGWSWYTGSSGWMYQFIIGSLIGMELLENKLKFKPCFPLDWPSVTITYRYGKATYNITVYQLTDGSETRWEMDGKQGIGDIFSLNDDGMNHDAEMYIAL